MTVSAEVMEVIHLRLRNGTDLMARSLSATGLMKVAGTAGFDQMLIAILQNSPSVEADDRRTVDRLARAAEFKRDLLKRAGGALTAKQVQKQLGYASVQAVHKAAGSHRLFVVEDNGRKLFPAFQFNGASVASGIPLVLKATRSTSPWALLQFLVKGDEGLGGEQPIKMINGSTETLDRLVRFARALED